MNRAAERERKPIFLVVPPEARGCRLDRFLVSALATLDDAPSRGELQRWIERERVTVDGRPRKASDKLREGARVMVAPEPPPRSLALAEAGIKFDVLYTDDFLLIVNKPPGLVVHPSRGHETGTLVNGLLARDDFERDPSEDDEDAVSYSRPGIVHRLDKGTSGVMVVAKTARVRERLKVQFQEHTILREYEALCQGDVRARTFSTLHGRHPTDRLRFTGKVKEGRHAVTHTRVLERLGGGIATHVACTLETGRTHQIRMHLSESGTPILGDPIYGKPPKSDALRTVAGALGHQALHARLLGFVHPETGKNVRFEADPPVDFAVALTALRAIPS